MSAKSKKKFKATKKEQPTHLLTICRNCRIRLIVPAERASTCGVCKSPDVSKEVWR